MRTYYRHSVELDIDKCKGCTSCLKHCPTEAIRIKDGKASINPDRCIDCSECIRVCPHNAKKAMCSKMEHYMDYKWKIALPAPVLFGQFEGLNDADYVLQGLLDIGFDDVYEVAQAAEFVSAYTRQYLKNEGVKRPVISSACPVVARLISMRFPYLKDNVLPLLPPVEIAADMARKKALEEHPEFKSEDIGIFFISPCAAKVSYIRNGLNGRKSGIDVVVSVSDIYFKLLTVMNRSSIPKISSNAGMIGIGWASSGGESTAILNDDYLAADGIENVINILEKIENGAIPKLEFIELNACVGGCVGGILTIENPFIAKTRLQTVRRYMPVSKNFIKGEYSIPDEYFCDEVPSYTTASKPKQSLAESMKMMAQIQAIKEALPGIDCGACGSPSCRAFAEDVVKGVVPSVDACLVIKGQKGGLD